MRRIDGMRTVVRTGCVAGGLDIGAARLLLQLDACYSSTLVTEKKACISFTYEVLGQMWPIVTCAAQEHKVVLWPRVLVCRDGVQAHAADQSTRRTSTCGSQLTRYVQPSPWGISAGIELGQGLRHDARCRGETCGSQERHRSGPMATSQMQLWDQA